MPTPEEIKRVWDRETEPDLPLELLDYRCVCEGFPCQTAFQSKLKEQFDKNFPKYMSEKRLLEKEWKEQKMQQARDKEELEDVDGAIQAARDWLEKHGEKPA